ncbi:MAG: 60 kDa inner membrane insertion protein [Parcubacteria group bacterium GW2011_GWA2_42_14]|nr:MAG: 60 kDa inner membrane insertion protein [Parcubacteria group bacterium GW2011_GWA2_42_14]
MILNPLMLIYNEVIYRPFLNGLILIYSFLPVHDMGLAIVIFTVLIRVLIYPLSHYSLKAQKKMVVIQPKIKEIQEKYKDKKEEQTRRIMELYKEHKTNPFSGCVLLILQLPVFIALFQVFRYGFDVSSFSYLYSFMPHPDSINPLFLGIIDVTKRNIFLSVLVGASQYVQALTMPQPQIGGGEQGSSFAGEFSKAMQANTKYMLPIFMAFISFSLPSALALYFTVSNVFVILQQMIVNRKTQ